MSRCAVVESAAASSGIHFERQTDFRFAEKSAPAMLAIGRHDAASRAELNSVYEAVIADVRDCSCVLYLHELCDSENGVFL